MLHDVNKENSKYVGNGILEISPVHSKSGKLPSFQFENYPVESNVLICSKFQESLHVDFGVVPLRTTKKFTFQLKNPSKSKAVKLALDRYNDKAGLHIILDTNESSIVNIEPSSTKEGTIFWTPANDCMMRVVIGLKMDDRAPLQIVAQGTAGTGIVRTSLEQSTSVFTVIRYLL